MSTAAASLSSSRDPFMPRRPAGMRAGLALALLAHALLIAGLAFSVDWHSSEPSTVEAELWSALPQQAAPRAAAPPPTAAPRPPEPPPAPSPRPQPVQPPPPPQVDPQIAIDKARQARQAQAQRELAEQDQARRDKARRDQARQDELDRQQAERDRQQQKDQQQARDDQARRKLQADKAQQAEKAEKAAKEKADRANAATAAATAAAQQAAARAAYLKRIQGMAGASGDSSSTGSAAKSSGPSASYAGRIMARIKPNVVFSDAVDGNPTATVEVRVAPDGTITSRRLVQSSGVKAWDDAVLRAIDRTDGLPRDIDGRVQPVMLLVFKPN